MRYRILGVGMLMLLSTLAQAQWKMTNGPYGGISRALLSYNNTVYAGTSGGGVFVSTDNGLHWKPSNKGLTNFTVGALTVIGSNLLAGTDGGGLFLSSDAGANWSHTGSGFTNLYVRALTARNGHVFAGTGGGVYLSTNSGSTWTNFTTGLTTSDVRALYITDTFVFAATYGGGIFRSGYSTPSWTALTTGSSKYIYSLAGNDTMLAAASGDKGIWTSSDKGENWTVSDELNNGLISNWCNSVMMTNGVLYAATFKGICKTTNQGLTWTSCSEGLLQQDIRSLMATGNTLFAGSNDGGVFRSLDEGSHWSLTGVQNTAVFALDVIGSNVFAGVWGNYAVHLTTDTGNTFSLLYNGFHYRTINAISHIDSVLFTAKDGDGLYRSVDWGKTWLPCDSGLHSQYAYGYCFVVNNAVIYAGTEKGVYKSTDKGITWTALFNGLINKQIKSLAISGDILVAGTKGSGVYLYNTTTEQWSPVVSGISAVNIYCLYAKGSDLYAGTESGLYKSVNNGTTWTAITNGIQWVYVYAMTSSAEYLFAGTNAGVYVSKDNGQSWVYSVNGIDGIASKDTRSLAVCNQVVYAGMYEGALWRRNISDLFAGISEAKMSRRNLIIYPNPARETVTVNCLKWVTGQERQLELFDIQGRIIRHILLTQPQTTIELSGLMPGYYYIRLQQDGNWVDYGKLCIDP